jgi:hypothetical protein
MELRPVNVVLSEMSRIVDNTEYVGLDLSDSYFKYQDSDSGDPYILQGNQKMFIKTDWVRKQLCKLIGVTERFYKLSPEDLSEVNLNTHSKFLGDKKSKSVLNCITQEDGTLVIRGILPENSLAITNKEVITEIVNYLGENNVQGIRDLSGVGVFDPEWHGIVVTNYTVLLDTGEWNRGYLLKVSELGSSKLCITPVLYNSNRDVYLVLQENSGKWVIEEKYDNPKNGTLSPNIRSGLERGDAIFRDLIDSLEDKFSKRFDDQRAVYHLLGDWSTRKNMSGAVIKKVIKTLDSQDEEEYVETAGELCELFLQEASSINFATTHKTSGFLANYLGFRA